MVEQTQFRCAQPQELQSILPLGMPGFETWAAVALEHNEVVGHVCLSRARGQVIGHDWAYWGRDKHAPLRLLLIARRNLRPGELLSIHFTPLDTVTREFWADRGFRPVLELLTRD